jgi:transcriptional regulator of acetoin/glycerol metabolism
VRPLTPNVAASSTQADTDELRAALAIASGNVALVARVMRVSRRTLDRRINAYGLRRWLTATYPLSVRQPKEKRRTT